VRQIPRALIKKVVPPYAAFSLILGIGRAWLTSRPGRFTPGREPRYWGNWVGPSVGLGVLEKMESVALSGSQTPVRSARNLIRGR